MSETSEVAADLRRAEALIAVNRPTEAQSILSRVLATSPGNVRAYCLLAQCANARDDYPAMLAAANQATTYGPELEWGHRLRSNALRCLGRGAEAVDAARVSVRLAPHLWHAYITLVEALLPLPDRDHRRAAYQAAERAVELAPQVPTTHVAMGRVLLSIGDNRAARLCFERALALGPDDKTAQINLAIVDLRQGRPGRAGRELGDAAAANPSIVSFATNVKIAALHWWYRAIDAGALSCVAVMLLLAFVRPPRLGGVIGLALIAGYVLVATVLYAQLPRPMRTLIRTSVRDRPNLIPSIAFGFVCAITVIGSIESLVSSAGADILRSDVGVLWLGALLVRFRYRIRTSWRSFDIRRTYRRHVVGDPKPATVPHQRSPSDATASRPSPSAAPDSSAS